MGRMGRTLGRISTLMRVPRFFETAVGDACRVHRPCMSLDSTLSIGVCNLCRRLRASVLVLSLSTALPSSAA